METLTDDASLPASLPVLASLAAFALLSFLTHLQQYKATYGLVYGEVKTTRCGWRSGCVSCLSAFSASGIWPT